MPIRKSGPGLLNPVTSAQKNYLSSTRGSVELVRDFTGGGGFSNADHLGILSEERCDEKKSRDVAYASRLKGLVSNLKGTEKRLIPRSRSTCSCLSVRGTTVSGTVPCATEFRYFLCSRYNVSPVNLQSHCNGCGTAFRVTHTLNCNISCLVIVLHNGIRD